jgi:RNA polymerase sigma factor (sigma-70 family)
MLINKAIDQLAPREAIIIKARFGLNNEKQEMSLKEIAQIIGRTRERVRQIEIKALNKLKLAQEIKEATQE